jgi:pimeloyl-ACP methyl ester carboxylesterase
MTHSRRMALKIGAAAPLLLRIVPAQAADAPAKLVTEEFMVEAADPSTRLFVRNKRPEHMEQFAPDRILLYVHGATQASETTFDLPLEGLSWMDYIARHGWDVYLMDVRGYGRSTHPPEMDQPPASNPPIVTTDVAIKDMSSVLDFILHRRGVAKINLMGWSWGCDIVGAYTAAHNEKANRLVLYGPSWLATKPTPPDSLPSLGAYRTSTMAATQARAQEGAPETIKGDLMPPAWFEMWSAAALATDPVGANQSPPVLRSPNGVWQDMRNYWNAGKPYYDPGQITVPTLVISAEWDGDNVDVEALFHRLGNHTDKRLVEVAGGTHMVIMETNRMQLFRAVQSFLNDANPPS